MVLAPQSILKQASLLLLLLLSLLARLICVARFQRLYPLTAFSTCRLLLQAYTFSIAKRLVSSRNHEPFCRSVGSCPITVSVLSFLTMIVSVLIRVYEPS